ncbi:MAG TPA: hypothetical protein VND41_04945 [Nitrososphaerales archaeon]|nr:hypothetical protein [Nitrososphaerales archaeon]
MSTEPLAGNCQSEAFDITPAFGERPERWASCLKVGHAGTVGVVAASGTAGPELPGTWPAVRGRGEEGGNL